MDEVVHAQGHEHVTATHPSTLEVTSDDYLTPAGDCILGVGADRVPADFDAAFVAACQDAAARVTVSLEAASHRERITGSGHPDLTFASERSLVARTSEFVDERTILVGADTAAAAVDRDLVEALADGAALTVGLRVD